MFEQAKKKIENEFFPDRGFGKMRLAEAKKAISEFGKLSDDETRMIDLMIFYVEQGVDFTNTYGDISENFYSSMESMYENALKKIGDNPRLYQMFNPRLVSLINRTGGIGWGFQDTLREYYSYWNPNGDEEEED
ncbi:DUF6155 family protein [Paenibacillus sp. HB172176]|uniref:DUF6155 family protein n=1 Tax=Paenibacillus sp. HB172176 TaxID=2493690 RepID=UPI00143A0748|nr:DUF6155 family protein [Paenibacillus sp. HB172176]